jgi:uncharacterized Zn finger protein (UPF0148 family)
MGLDEHVDSRCEDCNTPLVQLDGEWFCQKCNEGEEFYLTPDTETFTL